MPDKTITLNKPITAHGKDVSELTLREPNTEDLMEIGYPYLVIMREGADTGIELRPKVIVNYIAKLSGIPPSSAKKLSLGDLNTLQQEVMGFFGEEIASQSSN
jgi:hypothetical protein